MIQVEIPGYKTLSLQHLVLDYNGTLAIDGSLIVGLRPVLKELSEQLSVHVVTADTFGSAAQELEGTNCTLEILEPSTQDKQKEEVVMRLGSDSVIAIGNGRNDGLMLKKAALGIALIQEEGAATQTILNADIVCTSILDALQLLQSPKRLVATLRN